MRGKLRAVGLNELLCASLKEQFNEAIYNFRSNLVCHGGQILEEHCSSLGPDIGYFTYGPLELARRAH
jgi:hypothetical protein